MQTRAWRLGAGWIGWLLAAGMLIGPAGSLPSRHGRAAAEVRKETSQEQFKSGGLISSTILREIADTLKRIDTRLESIETAVRNGAREKAN